MNDKIERFIQWDKEGSGLRAIFAYLPFEKNGKENYMVFWNGYSGGGTYGDGVSIVPKCDWKNKKCECINMGFEAYEEGYTWGELGEEEYEPTDEEEETYLKLMDGAWGKFHPKYGDNGYVELPKRDLWKFKKTPSGQLLYETEGFDPDILPIVSPCTDLLTTW